MTWEDTLGCKENLATVTTIGAGRCFRMLLEEGADAVRVTAFAVSSRCRFAISNDKPFYRP